MSKRADRRRKLRAAAVRKQVSTSGPANVAGGPTAPSNAGVAPAPSTNVATTPPLQETALLLQLQIAKLRYEVGLGRRLEVIKGFLSLFTAVGVVFTVYLGITQQRQAAAYRNDDRFDRSITRLSSHEPSERLAGLAGIQQFLYIPDVDRQKSALIYLVNAASLEGDATVRSAIEEIFNRLPKRPLSNDVLDSALELARDDNTSLFRRRREEFIARENEAKRPLVDSHYSEVLIGSTSSPENLPLESTGRIIGALVRAGARISDLKGIYCVECDFTGKNIDQSGVSFEGAMLRRANFSHVRLVNASFRNADLVLTNFMNSNLKNADLSSDAMFVPYSIFAAIAVGDMGASYGTNFACADLQNANFSGHLLFTFIYDDPIWGGNERDEFYDANLDSANLSTAQFAVALPTSLFSGDPTKKAIPDRILPVPNVGLKASTEPLHYSGQDPYRIWTFSAATGGDLNVWDHYRRDTRFAFGSLHSARNWDRAALPASFRKVFDDHKHDIEKPPISYDCTTGQKNADISSMFEGGLTTGNARF